MMHKFIAITGLAACLSLNLASVLGHDDHAHHDKKPAAASREKLAVGKSAEKPAAKSDAVATPAASGAADAPTGKNAAASYFSDLELVDQDGKPHRFYSDLIRGKTVMINFIFASCKDACSPITANLAKVQRELGQRVGKDIVMLTITVDPANDTPAALKAYATQFKTEPGWYFLTGTKENVDAVLKRLGGYAEKRETHSTVLIIGDETTGNWVKTVGMTRPEAIVHAVTHINDGD